MMHKEIDWEQRRYEIAKALYCQYPHDNLNATEAIEYADVLIEKLKRQANENNRT